MVSSDTIKDVRERLTPLIQRTQACSRKIKNPKGGVDEAVSAG
jgi:hypothetical protein